MNDDVLSGRGRLEAIWIKRAKRGPMDILSGVRLQESRFHTATANRVRRAAASRRP